MTAVPEIDGVPPSVYVPVAVPLKTGLAIAGFAPNEVSEDAVPPLLSVVPVRLAAGTADAVIEVLQPKPLLVVHCSALEAVEHDPIERAVGDAAKAVALPTIVLAAWVARAESPISPVAVNEPVTVRPDIDGEVERTTLPAVPVTL